MADRRLMLCASDAGVVGLDLGALHDATNS